MVLATEEKQITLKLITTLREGGMLVHPTEPITIRGGSKGGGEDTLPYWSFFGVICLYTMKITYQLGLSKIE